MGKYKSVPNSWKSDEEMLLIVANELAEMNRLKRIELRNSENRVIRAENLEDQA